MIKLVSVTKFFDSLQIINNLNLEINEGEIVGLLGPNGAGKTTTVRMIAGVLPPTKGQVFINDKDLFQTENNYHPHIGYLPENNPIYDDMTVEEFLAYWVELKQIPKEKQQDNIKQAVKDSGLKDVYYRPISELSKGYRQRTGLAQAILSQPEILLLDEPTEGLDPNQRHDIHDLIRRVGKKRTVIICSHVLSEISRMCNRIIIINKGEIVADSPTKDLGNLSQGQIVYEFTASGAHIKDDLKALPEIKKVDHQNSSLGTLWKITTTSRDDLRLPIFELAKSKNWKLYELTRKQQDLEDIFSRLTKE